MRCHGGGCLNARDESGTRRERLETLCRGAGVAILYVFGSRADEVSRWLRDDTCPLPPGISDVDIAAKFLGSADVGVDRRVDLAIAVEDLLGVNRVDLVDLDQADAFLAANAIRGNRLYAADDYFADEYDLYVLRRAGDLAPLERQRLAMILGRDDGSR